jgi:hypothetical protein
MSELQIYPCLDGLIYYPIYLAIELFKYTVSGFHLVREPRPSDDQSVTWEFATPNGEVAHRITLMPPTGSDEKAIEAIARAPDSAVAAVAIADPMCAILDANHNSKLEIVATFINRIALWGVTRTKRRRLGGTDQIALLRAHIEEGFPLELDQVKQLNKLTWGYYKGGYTTRYLVKAFFDIDGLDWLKDNVGGFNWPELQAVVDGQYNVVFTNAPWMTRLITTEKDRSQLQELALFPPVPFPFSAVIAHRETTPNATLKVFLENLVTAISFAYRHPKKAVSYLRKTESRFRHYGLDRTADEGLIGAAVGRLNRSDIYSEECHNPWIPCDYALELIHRAEGATRPTWQEVFGQWSKVVNDNAPATSDNGVPDEEFFREEFRERIRRLTAES